jgi:hypothetical protein
MITQSPDQQALYTARLSKSEVTKIKMADIFLQKYLCYVIVIIVFSSYPGKCWGEGSQSWVPGRDSRILGAGKPGVKKYQLWSQDKVSKLV